MSDCQRVVDKIRSIVRSGEAASTSAVSELAAEYKKTVVEVNNRLGRCGEFLKRGLRSEAIQLAEQEPKLLDQVATLDFPEIEEWLDVLEVKAVELPEELLFDTADELNEAYGVVGQLDEVLKLHRRLALQKAPIKKRIEVIRKLESMDRDTSFWAEDLANYERARHVELANEISHFAKEHNRQEVDLRVAELMAADWSVEPAAATAKTALRIQKKIRSHTGRTEAAELEQRLRQAHSELNIGAARTIRMEWHAAIADANLRDDDPLVRGVQPVLDWIREQDDLENAGRKQAEANRRLRNGLQTATTSEDLIQMAAEAEVHGARPESLQQLYDDRLSELTSQEKTRKSSIIAGSAVVILISITSTFFILRGMIRADGATNVANQIRSAIAEGDFTTARSLHDDNRSYDGVDTWATVTKELNAAELNETTRVNEFELHIEAAEIAAESGADIADQTIAVNELARTPEEKGRARLLEQKLANARQKVVNTRKTEIASVLDKAREMLPIAQGFIDDPNRPIDEQLRTLGRQLNDVLAKSQVVPQKDLAELVATIEQVKELKEQRKTILSSLQIIRRMDKHSQIDFARADASQHVSGYVKSITELAEHFGSTADGVRLKKTLDEESTLWIAELAWWDLVSAGGVLPSSKASTDQRMTDVRGWLDTTAGSPSKAMAEQYLKILKARDRQGTVTSGIIQEIRTFLENRLLSDCWQIQLNDKTYYGPADLRQGESKFEWYEDWDGRRTKSRPFSGNRPIVIRAPQVELVGSLRQRLLGITPKDWESRLLPIALGIQKDKTVDAFLRFYLLRRICNDAQSGSEFLKTELAEVQQVFNTKQIVLSADWMDPDNQEANDARQIIESDLNTRLTGLEAAWRKAIDSKRKFLSAIGRVPRSIGWLDLRKGGFWRCRTSYKPQEDTESIYTLSPRVNQWQRVGSIDSSGKVTLTNDSSLLGQGRLVFVNVK